MRKMLILAALLLFGPLHAQDVGRYVNPFTGTAGMGHCFPGACVPFGGVQLSPDTDTIPHNVAGRYQKEVYAHCAGYNYEDPTIVGFSHTHLSGTGHSDLGDILIMPQTGDLKLRPGTVDSPGYRQHYSHERESASPGYYEVLLQESGVKARLTATERVGVHSYVFPDGKERRLIVDLLHGIYNYEGKVLWSSLRVVGDTLVTGSRYTNGWARFNQTFFAISFSRPIVSYGYQDRHNPQYRGFWRKFDLHHNFPDMAGREVTAFFEFAPGADPLEVKVALSGTSVAGALKNLEAETAGKSFETIRKEAAEAWERELSVIRCEGTEEQKRIFYTALYHTLINPSVYMDVDGLYRGVDGEVHQADGFTNYTVFSLWDTYRAEHPLLGLLKPSRNTDMVRSMLAHRKQSPLGMLPVWSLQGNEGWCMSGYHAVSVLADAIVKGAPIPLDEALDAMVSTARNPYLKSAVEYARLGYAPFDEDATAASNTLEYAYDDWCIAQVAQLAGKSDLAAEFYRRSGYWQNLFLNGFATPRYRDGSFKEPFDPLQTYGEGFIEGNSWNFSFHVPQDVIGLRNRMGGEKAFRERLDRLFEMSLPEAYYAGNEDITADGLIGGYVHGNEPSHHIPYLYAWTSQPWKTQDRVREIMARMYRDGVYGLGGNDDCGQMSAWYVFSALGFYPVTPGQDTYVLGAPSMPYFSVQWENGNTLEIKATGLSERNKYVQEVLLNGKPLSGYSISHRDLLNGGTLEFKMGRRPKKLANYIK